MLAKILKNKTGELGKKSVFGFKRYWRFVKLFFKQIMRRIRRRNPRLTQWDISPLKTQKAANRLFFIFYILSVGCGFVSSVITTKIEEGTIKLQNGYQELADGKHRLSDGYNKLAAGKRKLADGKKRLADGKKKLSDGKVEYGNKSDNLLLLLADLLLNDGDGFRDARRQIADGEQRVADGERQVADGERRIVEGKKQLADGEQKVADGERRLREGESQLHDGKIMRAIILIFSIIFFVSGTSMAIRSRFLKTASLDS